MQKRLDLLLSKTILMMQFDVCHRLILFCIIIDIILLLLKYNNSLIIVIFLLLSVVFVIQT